MTLQRERVKLVKEVTEKRQNLTKVSLREKIC